MSSVGMNTVLLFVKIRMFIHGEIMSMGSVGNRLARLSNSHRIQTFICMDPLRSHRLSVEGNTRALLMMMEEFFPVEEEIRGSQDVSFYKVCLFLLILAIYRIKLHRLRVVRIIQLCCLLKVKYLLWVQIYKVNQELEI